MIQNRRNKVLSLHEPQNLITLDSMETPQFNNTRRRVLTQMEDEHPKLVLPRIKLGNNHKNLPSNNNEKKFKLTGVKEAFFQPRQLNKLPQILKGLQKSDNPSQPDFRKIRQDKYKASAYTLDVNE